MGYTFSMEKDPISREDSLAFCNGTKPLSELPKGAAALPLPSGTFTLIDAEQLPWLESYRWYEHRAKYTSYVYADTSQRDHGIRTRLTLHRVVAGAYGEVDVDHLNGNGLDNRSINVRIATTSENRQHQMRPRGTTSRHKGVCWDSSREKWMACISSADDTGKTKTIYLGRYDSEDDAGRAYDTAAILLFGEWAYLNFPLNQADKLLAGQGG